MPENVARRRKSGATANPESSSSNNTVQTTGANGVPAPPGEANAAIGRTPVMNREEFKKTVIQSIIRALLMYLAIRYFAGNQNESSSNATGGTGAKSAKPTPSPVRSNVWAQDMRYDVRVFTSLHQLMSLREAVKLNPVYAEKGFVYTLDDPNYRGANITIDIPEDVSRRNASLYAHIFVTKQGTWAQDNIHPTHVVYTTYNLISWRKGHLQVEETNLIGKRDEDPAEAERRERERLEAKDKIFQLVAPQLSVTLVTDYNSLSNDSVPPFLARFYKAADDVAGFPTYYPPLFVNEFWLFRDILQPMNETVRQSTLEVTFAPMSMKKWALQAQFDATMDMQIQYGTTSARETDKIKRMLIETNPILLGTTMLVSLAHSILEALAFRNDISHWRSIKSMEGISVRSMGVKIFMEIVIFLYLLDNDTSWMIIIGNAVGILIEVWKLAKAVEFKNFGKRRLLGFIPWFETADRDSYSRETKEYDEEAMRYLSYVAYPLVVAYSIYSLYYEKHKSWYSWILGSLVGAVYAFGFLLMVPAVYINYKLKSVAHLPMRAMAYKALNTIIDDLFSFVIKMPWMHRLACFRDDVIFIVFLYQCWIYPVDKTRVNEFGQTFDDDGNEVVRPPPSDDTSSSSSVSAPSSTLRQRKSRKTPNKSQADTSVNKIEDSSATKDEQVAETAVVEKTNEEKKKE